MAKDPHLPDEWQGELSANELLGKLLVVLQLFSSVPVGGRIHAIRPSSQSDFTQEDVISFPKDIGRDPNELEIHFISKDNLDALRQHYKELWQKDWQLIQLPMARYMHSYTRDIFNEGFAPDDAFMDLMLSLDNIFGSPGAVGYKVALRASCLLEGQGPERRKLNRTINSWYGKRSKIAHGKGQSQAEWNDVEALREIVRKSILKAWQLQFKGDAFDDYLFLVGK